MRIVSSTYSPPRRARSTAPSQTYMADDRFPTMDGSTSTDGFSYASSSKTGTIPSQVGLMVGVTQINVRQNAITGTVGFNAPLVTLHPHTHRHILTPTPAAPCTRT